jgi:erythromycin esterase
MVLHRTDRRATSVVDLAESLRQLVRPVRSASDLDPLLERVGDARIVLLGEASHGTMEFYGWRAAITQRLVREKGFCFLAVEGDWPDCYRLNRYVRAYPSSGTDAADVLHEFRRWPTWMWANWEIVGLAEWLREWNARLSVERRIGFYGLDVYSLFESMEAVIDYLRPVDPEAAERAVVAYRCFDPYHNEEQQYARATALVPASCEDEVIDTLMRLRTSLPAYPDDSEARFDAEQNALVAVNAERYYRAMIRTDAGSWNIRDRHMLSTLDRLLALHGRKSRAVVWAHNTHVGDARATDMAAAGMVNLGQLARERYGADLGVVVVGFSTFQGSVIAGDAWGAPMRRMLVPPAATGTHDEALHEASAARDALFVLDAEADGALRRSRGQRAIGVVYDPEYERVGNYVPTVLPLRYDVMLHCDVSHALRPLHLAADPSQAPATYPWRV